MGSLYEFGGAAWVVEGGVAFVVALFAAIVEDGGGDGDGVVGVALLDALHGEQVEGEVHHGAGVADESTFSQGVGGVVFAGGGGGPGPEAGGCGILRVTGEGAELGVCDEGDLCIELCFHGLCCVLLC